MIESEGIEIYSQVGRSYISWFEIREIKSYGMGIFKELRIFLKEPVNNIRFVAIRLCFLDRHSLKQAAFQTHPENPLHEAVVKYL